MSFATSAQHRICIYQSTNLAHHTLTALKQNPLAGANPYAQTPPGHGSNEYTTGIWAGKVADQDCGPYCDDHSFTYTEIDADWYIPCITVTSASPIAQASQWLGIGGTTPNYGLIQAGSATDQTYEGGGKYQMSYAAWWEWVIGSNTNYQQNVNIGAGCGTHLYVRVSAPNCYFLDNLNNHDYFSTCSGYYGEENTAEGILERVGEHGIPYGSDVLFKGVGITETTYGYISMGAAWHDYFDLNYDNGLMANPGGIISDPNDPPYDDYWVNVDSVCGGVSSC